MGGCALLFQAVIPSRNDCRKVMGEILVAGEGVSLGVREPGKKPSWEETTSSGHWYRGEPPWGVLPYITYTGMCRPTGSWFWSSWFRTGYPFQRRCLERGIIFRTHESSSFVSSHLKLFKGKKTKKNTAQCVNEQTVILLLHPRTEYKKLAHF